MAENEIIPETAPDSSWKVKTLVVGTLIGALTGLGAAFLLTRRAEQKGEKVSISTGQGVKLGMLVVGLLRSILNLGEE
jgi:ABC-type Mn2+/Zn2+ transport system permease subunit